MVGAKLNLILWVSQNVEDRIPLLDKEGVATLLTEEAKTLSEKVSEFNERSERWTQLASLALLYGDSRQTEFIVSAAECLIGYGWRKDLIAMDVLDAVVELSEKNSAYTQARIEKLTPIIDVITEFTDGDETDHVRSELIEAIAKVAPKMLPSLYEHHLSMDEHRFADECLIKVAEVMNLDSPEGAALARTFLDEKTLEVLEERAGDDSAAGELLDCQNAFLGRQHKADVEGEKTRDDEVPEHEKDTVKTKPPSFGCNDFAAVVKVASTVHYEIRREFLVNWLQHWKRQGKANLALDSILSYFETSDSTYEAEDILDEAFLVSLAIRGREDSYHWLVKAHIHRRG